MTGKGRKAVLVREKMMMKMKYDFHKYMNINEKNLFVTDERREKKTLM